jgi:GntR family transcriptional regulator/MocR family aminotransferase
MPRAANPALTLPPLDAEGDLPLHRQLYFALRRAILDGRLAVGGLLPSSRAMAAQLGLSRTTVMAALDQLASEGYIQSRPGSGTRVAPAEAGPAWTKAVASQSAPRPLSRLAVRLGQAHLPEARGAILPFAPGLPDLAEFPHRDWSRLLARRWRRGASALMALHDPAGYPPLRAAIADHLGRTRAVRCDADQVVVLAGSQQGLDLAARLLLDPGDQAMVEDPCYGGLKGALLAAGAEPVPVPVDHHGFDPQLAERLWPKARLACVTPSHQFPTGATMPVDRRLDLIRWAGRTGGWIIEDDYDGDFRYKGAPLAALQGLDQSARTIHLGTFSKSLFPALRLGWMVAPPDLLPLILKMRRMTDTAASALTQAAVADFMAEGLFTAHLRRMRARYAQRRALLLDMAERYLGGRMVVEAGDAGTNAIGWLPSGCDDRAVAARLRQRGLGVAALGPYRINPGRPGLILGYGAMADQAIEPAMAKLAKEIYSLL